MPLVAAAIITAAATTGATVYSARKSDQAMKTQAASQAEATKAATETSDKTLDFEKEQAALDAQRQETNRRADYDQWRARESRIGSLGQLLGLPSRDIPEYVPFDQSQRSGTLPSLTSGGSSASSAARMPKQGEVDWSASPDQLSQQLAGYFQRQGVPTVEVPYWTSKAQELIDRGKELNDPLYADKRLSAADVFGGGGSSTASAGPRMAMASPGSLAALTPAYQAPVIRPGSLRALAA